MKIDIHPTYFPEAKVVCACGNAFTTGATVPEIRLEVCNKCHPFFTGKEKLVDTEGRLERFERRMRSKVESKPKKDTPVEPEKSQPATLREMMMAARKSQGR